MSAMVYLSYTHLQGPAKMPKAKKWRWLVKGGGRL